MNNTAIAACLMAFRQGLDDHDAKNPDHTATGIGLSAFDLNRLGFDDGEVVAPGITVHADGGVTGNFRVICDGLHDGEESEPVKAVSEDSNPGRARDLAVYY
jgi:hypothetical protein